MFFPPRVYFGGKAGSTGGCFDVARTHPQAGAGKFNRGQLLYRNAVCNKLRETVTWAMKAESRKLVANCLFPVDEIFIIVLM